MGASWNRERRLAVAGGRVRDGARGEARDAEGVSGPGPPRAGLGWVHGACRGRGPQSPGQEGEAGTPGTATATGQGAR